MLLQARCSYIISETNDVFVTVSNGAEFKLLDISFPYNYEMSCYTFDCGDPMLFSPLSIPDLIEWAKTDHQSNDCFFLMVAHESYHQLPELLSTLRQENIQAFGGIFVQLIHEAQLIDEGCIAVRFKSSFTPRLVRRLDGTDFDLSHLPERPGLPEGLSMITLIDSLSTNLIPFLDKLYSKYGSHVRYFGGGAGTSAKPGADKLKREDTVFTTVDGWGRDAAVVALVENPSAMVMKHGWRRVYGPLIATRIQGNVIEELNWQPAAKVYQEAVEGVLGRPIPEDHLDNLDTIGFPFGMIRDDAEDLVRLPISVTESGGLLCVGGIANNSVLHILQGVPEELINVARDAAVEVSAHVDQSATSILVMNCVTRSMFLGKSFGDELLALDTASRPAMPPVIGALSEGEICCSDGGHLEWLNKSIAIGAFF